MRRGVSWSQERMCFLKPKGSQETEMGLRAAGNCSGLAGEHPTVNAVPCALFEVIPSRFWER